jgi:hypothetical protein
MVEISVHSTNNIPETTEIFGCPTDNIPETTENYIIFRLFRVYCQLWGIPPVPILEEIQLLMYGHRRMFPMNFYNKKFEFGTIRCGTSFTKVREYHCS